MGRVLACVFSVLSAIDQALQTRDHSVSRLLPGRGHNGGAQAQRLPSQFCVDVDWV